MTNVVYVRDRSFSSVWSSPTLENAIISMPQSPQTIVAGVGSLGLLIRGFITIVLGTGATGLQIRCREGVSSISGPQVGETITLTGLVAGNEYDIPVQWADVNPMLGDVQIPGTQLWNTPAGVAYTITGLQTGAPTGPATTDKFSLTIETAP